MDLGKTIVTKTGNSREPRSAAPLPLAQTPLETGGIGDVPARDSQGHAWGPPSLFLLNQIVGLAGKEIAPQFEISIYETGMTCAVEREGRNSIIRYFNQLAHFALQYDQANFL